MYVELAKQTSWNVAVVFGFKRFSCSSIDGLVKFWEKYKAGHRTRAMTRHKHKSFFSCRFREKSEY